MLNQPRERSISAFEPESMASTPTRDDNHLLISLYQFYSHNHTRNKPELPPHRQNKLSDFSQQFFSIKCRKIKRNFFHKRHVNCNSTHTETKPSCWQVLEKCKFSLTNSRNSSPAFCFLPDLFRISRNSSNAKQPVQSETNKLTLALMQCCWPQWFSSTNQSLVCVSYLWLFVAFDSRWATRWPCCKFNHCISQLAAIGQTFTQCHHTSKLYIFLQYAYYTKQKTPCCKYKWNMTLVKKIATLA